MNRRASGAGAGAWGTALAQALASDGSQVLIWAREAELVDEINTRRTNSLFLPSAQLSPGDARDRRSGRAGWRCRCCSRWSRRSSSPRCSPGLPRRARDLVLCAKGIEAGTGRLMADVAREAAPGTQPRGAVRADVRARSRRRAADRSHARLRGGRGAVAAAEPGDRPAGAAALLFGRRDRRGDRRRGQERAGDRLRGGRRAAASARTRAPR